MPSLRWGCHSITGNFRENNEDRCFADPQGRYFLVADGMGGQLAGEKASELAIEIISNELERSLDFENDSPKKVRKLIDAAVSHANSEIMALSEYDPNYHNMGTTIVFLVQVGGTLYVGGVGDSRAYRLRAGGLEQLTTDHSLTRALVEAGTISEEEAATHRYRNVLYRYLGTKEGSAGTEAKELTPETGDRFLLCTDGVTDGLKKTDPLKALLEQHDDPQEAAQAIVEAALDAGSRDNITCIVVHVGD